MKSMTVVFERDKDTETKARFQPQDVGDGRDATVGPLYVLKELARDVRFVRVTIEPLTEIASASAREEAL